MIRLIELTVYDFNDRKALDKPIMVNMEHVAAWFEKDDYTHIILTNGWITVTESYEEILKLYKMSFE